MRSLPLLAAFFVSSRAALAGDVLVVAPHGGGFTDIPPAVTAAHDGDILLVEGGNYSNFTITGKSVSIVSDVGQIAHVTGPVMVVDNSAPRVVLLSGLQVFGAPIPTGFGLSVQGSSGSVRVQGCHIQGGEQRTGASIQSSSDVALTDTTLVGGNGKPGLISLDPNADGATGLLLHDARVALYDSSVHGGDGSPTTCFGGNGGTGMQVISSYVFAAGSLVRGGNGAAAQNLCFANCYYCVCQGGVGGNGVTLEPAGGSLPSQLISFMNALQPGSSGLSGQNVKGCCGLSSYCDGDPAELGRPISVGAGDIYEPLGGSLPLFTVSQNPVREQSTVTLRFAGQAGDEIYLFANRATGFTPSIFKGVQLVLHMGQSHIAILGQTDANGILEVTYVVPDLGPGVQGHVLHMQSMHKNLAGHFILGNPVSLVMLDRAF